MNPIMTMRCHPEFPDAWVSCEAILGDDVVIGPGAVIYPGVEIGAGSSVGEHCVLGHQGPGEARPLSIGRGSVIRSFTVIYAGSRFGSRLETGHHVVIREQTTAGENLRVGNFSDIEGHCTIGDYCRFHGYTHVGKGSHVGHFVWLYSLTTATNDPLPPSTLSDPVRIDDGVVVCVGAILMPGVHLGKGAFVSGGAIASGAIPAGAVVSGTDGRVVSHVSQLIHFSSGTRHPWMRHFVHVYPEDAHERINLLMAEIMAARNQLHIEPFALTIPS